MIHIYCGDGKGKTTAAMGLALRMAGRGRRVVVAQFLKGSDSGERKILATMPQILLLDVPEQVTFTKNMDDSEREREQARNLALLEYAHRAGISSECGLVVLDEVCAGINTGLLPLDRVLACLDEVKCEVVLTGRDPVQPLLDRAHYITEMVNHRHPFEKGVPARVGVEK